MPKHGIGGALQAASEQSPVAAVRPSRRIAKAIGLMLSGECRTQRAAAERAGVNASHLCEMLGRPEIRAFVANETRRAIERAQMPAAGVLAALLDAESERVRAEVATRVLAINGIRAEADRPAVSVDVRVGYVIALDGAAATIEPDKSET